MTVVDDLTITEARYALAGVLAYVDAGALAASAGERRRLAAALDTLDMIIEQQTS